MATSQVRTRKRPAPGASPLSQTQSPVSASFQQVQPQEWQPQFPANSPFPANYSTQNQSAPQAPAISQPQAGTAANQLAKRNANQPVTTMPEYVGNQQWEMTDRTNNQISGNGWGQPDDLDRQALLAKEEAERRRKQIPPFVQKLSSFLDESRNTDLIRWTESGDSFVVLDEDEFAKTLIPELFKHNNYASFVRQLNMYGFHKKVGLSDNSMRASERKNKTPSEYSHPFFKRGRPNLLWLIQKPKSMNPAKKNRPKSEDFDDEVDETIGRDQSPFPHLDNLEDLRNQKYITMGSTPVTMPQDQLSGVQKELENIRHNQARIATMLNEVRREHKQLYGQAKAFHELHERHDNSINAILSFLAAVYNKQINTGEGGLNSMFPGTIPPSERGNVVEVGDVRDQSGNNTPKPVRRGPLLLEDGRQHPSTKSRSSDQIPSPTIQELSDSGRSTPTEREREGPLPQADIMSMLNASAKSPGFNANSPMDFSEALSHIQNTGGSTPLTPGERQNMLQLMSNDYQPSESGSNLNNALTNYPSNSVDPAAQFDATTNNLDQLGQIIKEQSNNINSLSNTLTPLSPSGSIPGFNPDLNPSNDLLDLDNIFNSDSYFNDTGNGFNDTGDTGFDFADLDTYDLDTNNVGFRDGSEALTPATVKTIDDDLPEEVGSPRKKTRLG